MNEFYMLLDKQDGFFTPRDENIDDSVWLWAVAKKDKE